ncbi:MAG: putative glycoside hydrolase [Gemmatimonadota bacterium]
MKSSSRWFVLSLATAAFAGCDASAESYLQSRQAEADSMAAATGRAGSAGALRGETGAAADDAADPAGGSGVGEAGGVAGYRAPAPAAGEEGGIAPDDETADVDAAAPAAVRRATTPVTIPDEPPVFARPRHVRGIYLNAWASGSLGRTSALIEMASRTEINSFVIDIKDASGYVSYATNVPLAQEIGATGEIRIRDISGLLERLRAAGIYPIARIVVFQDPLLANRRPDLAIQDSAGGVWMDGSGHSWVNPYHTDVWDYNIALAEEAARLGFPEIQWDYVRFPDASNEDLARSRYPRQDGRKRSIAIREFLIAGNEGLEELDVEITADVFGVATSAKTDVGIGQLWEDFIDVVHVALPMVYPSHYWVGSFGIQDPNGRPYEVVLAALNAGMERSLSIPGAGSIRPWLQDFTLGAPRYGAPEVRAQIQATYDAGIDEWILWNASGRYTEAAFAPAEGFPEDADPLIRFGGEIVPASARYGVRAEAVTAPEPVLLEAPIPGGVVPLPTTIPRPAGSAAADSVPPFDVPDPVRDSVPPDSVPVAPNSPDPDRR